MDGALCDGAGGPPASLLGTARSRSGVRHGRSTSAWSHSPRKSDPVCVGRGGGCVGYWWAKECKGESRRGLYVPSLYLAVQQRPHFPLHRNPLSVCLPRSVGFGDLTPEGERARLFTAFFAIAGVLITGLAVSEVKSHDDERVQTASRDRDTYATVQGRSCRGLSAPEGWVSEHARQHHAGS